MSISLVPLPFFTISRPRALCSLAKIGIIRGTDGAPGQHAGSARARARELWRIDTKNLEAVSKFRIAFAC
jgi:hypothetical protein